VNVDQVKASILPQFFPASWLAEYPIVASEFPSRIRIGYVLPETGGYSYLLHSDFEDLGLTVAELHGFALENLAGLPSGRMALAAAPWGPEGFIASDDVFAAARILLPHIRAQFSAKLGDKFLVTLPHREWCFCWSQSQPVERQAKNAAEALEDFINNKYNLTPDILMADPDGFSLYQAQNPGLQQPPAQAGPATDAEWPSLIDPT
jgi:hypothetical protein